MIGDALQDLWRAERAPELGPDGWESLLSQARCARLSARLARLFDERGWQHSVPPGPRTHLANAAKEARRKADEVRWESDRIADALASLPATAVLLKGAAYVMAGLPPGTSRWFSDIDILVPRQQIRDVEQALFAKGWIAQKLDPYDERYYRDWMHELPPLQHVLRQTLLDVHHTITPPTSRFAVDAAPLLERALPLAGNPGLAVLAPADMVLHGVAHLFQDGDFSAAMRDLLDFDELLRHFGNVGGQAFWPDLLRRAGETGLGTVLFYAWSESHRLFDTPAPREVRLELEALAPPALRRRTMHALLVHAIRPDHPDCDRPATPWARWLLYVRSHWLRMPWYQIVPHLARKAWKRARRVAKLRPEVRPAI